MPWLDQRSVETEKKQSSRRYTPRGMRARERIAIASSSTLLLPSAKPERNNEGRLLSHLIPPLLIEG